MRTPPLSRTPQRIAVRSERLHQNESHGYGSESRCQELENGDWPPLKGDGYRSLHDPDRRERGAAGPRGARPEREPGEAEPESERDEVSVRHREEGRSQIGRAHV